MGLGSFLFGSKPKATTSQTSTLSKQQQQVMDFLAPYLQNSAKSASSDNPPLSNLEQTSLAGLETYAHSLVNGANQNTGQPSSLATTAGSTLEDILKGQPQDIDPYFTTGVQDPMLKAFNERIVPNIEKKFAGNQNFFGGDRIGAVDRAQEDLFSSLASARANAVLSEFDSTRNAKLQGLQTASDISTLPQRETAGNLANLLTTLTAGGVPRQQQQSGVDLESSRINQLLQLLGLNTTENITTTSGGSSGNLGGIANLAGTVAGFFSDIRLKENIIPIGSFGPVPAYSFNYLWSPIKYVGALAQEVKAIFPQAVYEESGYLKVNYDTLQEAIDGYNSRFN